MLPSFLLSFREGIEAALIIGIVIGVLHRIRRQDLIPFVWRGAASAALVSMLAATLLNVLGAEFEGKAEEIFEGIAMLLAALILTWMIFWMKRHASALQQELESDVRKAAFEGGGRAIWLLAFLAIGREGLELALFLTAASLTSDVLQTIIGAVIGLSVSALFGYVLFSSTRRLNLKNFFLLTNSLLILFAAGLVAHGIHEFNEAGLVPPIVEHVWDTNAVLPEKSTFGSILTALFGYNGNPSLSEVMAYVLYFLSIWFMTMRNSIGLGLSQKVEA